jgi:hypothetical protein
MSDWKGPAAVVLAIIAFATKPPIQAFKAQVDGVFANARQNSWSSGNFESWAAAAAIDNLRSGQYHDYFLASTYSVTAAGETMLNCYGLFGTVFCGAPDPMSAR